MKNSHTSLPVQHCFRFLKTQIRKTINIGDTVNKIILVNFSSYFCGRGSSASSFETASQLTGRALHAGSQISKTVFTHALSQTPDRGTGPSEGGDQHLGSCRVRQHPKHILHMQPPVCRLENIPREDGHIALFSVCVTVQSHCDFGQS